MRSTGHWIGLAVVAGLALGLPVLAPTGDATAQPAPAAASVVLDDQLLSQIKRGETKMAQVRALIAATPTVNYQAGHEIWIYQGVSAAAGGQRRTVTVQYDEIGAVRNVGVTDLK